MLDRSRKQETKEGLLIRSLTHEMCTARVLQLMQAGADTSSSEAQPKSDDDERGALLGEAMLDGSLVGVDGPSVAESAANCILSHPDAPTRKVSRYLVK